jgi:hypothetical protein
MPPDITATRLDFLIVMMTDLPAALKESRSTTVRETSYIQFAERVNELSLNTLLCFEVEVMVVVKALPEPLISLMDQENRRFALLEIEISLELFEHE